MSWMPKSLSRRRSSSSSSRRRRTSQPPLPNINIAEKDLSDEDIAEITFFLKNSPHFKKKYEQKVGAESWRNIFRQILETNKLKDATKIKIFSMVDPNATSEMNRHLTTYKKVKHIAKSHLDPYNGDIEMKDEHERFKQGNPFGGKRKSRRNRKH